MTSAAIISGRISGQGQHLDAGDHISQVFGVQNLARGTQGIQSEAREEAECAKAVTLRPRAGPDPIEATGTIWARRCDIVGRGNGSMTRYGSDQDQLENRGGYGGAYLGPG